MTPVSRARCAVRLLTARRVGARRGLVTLLFLGVATSAGGAGEARADQPGEEAAQAASPAQQAAPRPAAPNAAPSRPQRQAAPAVRISQAPPAREPAAATLVAKRERAARPRGRPVEVRMAMIVLRARRPAPDAPADRAGVATDRVPARARLVDGIARSVNREPL